MLNYLYALLEAETMLACQAVGLDPGIGLFHADRRDRASLALDLMEACRPVVDAYLLALLTQCTLTTRDFVETRRGACRLLAPLASELADSSLVWRNHVAPIVEGVAKALDDASPRGSQLATPVTGSARITAWEPRRREPPRKLTPVPKLPTTCRGCGAQLASQQHRYCAVCRLERFREVGEKAGRQQPQCWRVYASRVPIPLTWRGGAGTRTQECPSSARATCVGGGGAGSGGL